MIFILINNKLFKMGLKRISGLFAALYIRELVTDYIQKRRGQALLFSFDYNLLPKFISYFYALHGLGIRGHSITTWTR